MRGCLAGPEGLNAVAAVVVGSIEFPAQAVVHGDRIRHLVAVLGEKIERRVTDVFPLRRALLIGVRGSQEVVRIGIVSGDLIAIRLVNEGIVSADFEVEKLIETLAPDIATEFESVLAHRLRVVVRPLESISGLGKFSLKVVADRKASGNIDEWKPDTSGKIRCDSGGGIARVGKTIGRRNVDTGILNASESVQWMVLTFLRFAEVVKAEFVDSG